MIIGNAGFTNTGPRCCFVRGSGRVRWPMLRMWSRRHSCVSGGTSAGSEASPTALLLTSMRRAACDLARREKRRAIREERAGGGLDPDVSLFVPLSDNDHRRRSIETALQRLPAEQREVLVLKIWGELTFGQIAMQLEIPANTASSRYRYALAAIRKELTSVSHA